MIRILFLTFLIVPIIEIGLFIALGQAIGLWPTLLGIVITALIGSAIIRSQGVSLIAEIRRLTAQGQMPARQIADGFMLGISGALLLTPGYFTDAIGFLFLVPAIRGQVYQFVSQRVQIFATSSYSAQSSHPFNRSGAPHNRDDSVVDLDPDDWREDDDQR